MDEKWGQAEQSLWDCVKCGLTGLKRLCWLTTEEYEKLLNEIQDYINNK